MIIYGIKDVKSGDFDVPIFQVNELTFKRNMIHTIKQRPDLLWASNPEDFDVYVIGEYDQRLGVIKSIAPDYKFNLKEILDLHE